VKKKKEESLSCVLTVHDIAKIFDLTIEMLQEYHRVKKMVRDIDMDAQNAFVLYVKNHMKDVQKIVSNATSKT
jgi:hypothetical protein